MQTGHVATYQTIINAPVEKVWDALTNPELVKQYFFGSDQQGDWRPGGAITWTGEYEGKRYVDKGIIQEYVPNEKLSFTYLSSWSGKEDIPENYLFVTYAVKPVDEGTELTITQTNYDDEKAKHSAENWGVGNRWTEKDCGIINWLKSLNKIYVFSGLGVDRRVFNDIDFGDLDITHVEWIKPEPDEPLVHYAQRIAANRIAPYSALIGLSFGGMLSVEIAKLIPVDKIILIASAKTKNELPRGFLMKCLLKLRKFIPEEKLTSPNVIADWFFGAKTAREKQLLRDILKDTDPAFFKWAVNEIIHWENETMPANSIHIHGNKDRIIPIKNVKADYVIGGGGHLMTVSKAKEIGQIIRTVV